MRGRERSNLPDGCTQGMIDEHLEGAKCEECNEPLDYCEGGHDDYEDYSDDGGYYAEEPAGWEP